MPINGANGPMTKVSNAQVMWPSGASATCSEIQLNSEKDVIADIELALLSYRKELRILTAEEKQSRNGHSIHFLNLLASICPAFRVNSGDGPELPHSAP
jgi:hypothetical protein